MFDLGKEFMKKHLVFIDGAHGTTGLEIKQRLLCHPNVELLSISEEDRKDQKKRVELIEKAELSFLCLPDEASRQVVGALKGAGRLLDASTAHRTHRQWVYGLPEIASGQREKIKGARRVSVPGCHATGFVLLARPLVEKRVLDSKTSMVAFSVTGYSGGGKAMIQQYEKVGVSMGHSGQYGLAQDHKHLPEMKRMSLLSREPTFIPVVGNYYRGMVVSLPLGSLVKNLRYPLEELEQLYSEYYSGEELVGVRKRQEGFLYGDEWAGYDDVMITVYGKEENPMVAVSFDNLGKGASAAAVQCMNLMLGLPESQGLTIGKKERAEV